MEAFEFCVLVTGVGKISAAILIIRIRKLFLSLSFLTRLCIDDIVAVRVCSVCKYEFLLKYVSKYEVIEDR